MAEDDLNKEPEKGNVVDMTNIFTFGEVIKMPVEAVVQANIDASKEVLKFIKNFGFEPGDDPKNPYDVGAPKMLTFTYLYNNSGVEQKMTVQIPVLSLVTIPLLNITKAEFDVGINVINMVKTQVDNGSNSPETRSEILTLLGSSNHNTLTNLNETTGSISYSTGVKTNMQAKIKVETSDLPAGILQMLNLFQEATTGESSFLYTLKANTETLRFDASHNQLSVTVTLLKDKKPVNAKTIMVTVLSNTSEALEKSFSEPIEVTKGDVVGIPTLAEAQALTVDEGEVTFMLTARTDLTEDQNGYLRFDAPGASGIQIYYSITQSNEQLQ